MPYVIEFSVALVTLADRIVVMRDGDVEQIGTPLELYDRPANEFVGGFIGSPSMNFLAGSVKNGSFVTTDGIVLPIDGQAPEGASRYGLRPEHIELSGTGLPLEVVVVEPTGSETMIVGRLGKQTVTAVFKERVEAAPGTMLNVSFDPKLAHLFGIDGRRVV